MTGPRYVRSPGGVSVEISGEHVMLGPDMNEYFGFRDVAAYIWEQLEQPRSVDELCAAIVAEYAVDRTTCRRDTDAFLAELVDMHLAQVEDRPDSHGQH